MVTLSDEISACREILYTFGEMHWVAALDRALQAINQEDSPQVKSLVLGWFGAAGSLNDVIICRYNGHDIDEKNEKNVNDHLSTLRDSIFTIASKL